MHEIEVKILEIDVKDVTSRMKKLGARRVFDGRVMTAYYDFPLRALHKKGCSLGFSMREAKPWSGREFFRWYARRGGVRRTKPL